MSYQLNTFIGTALAAGASIFGSITGAKSQESANRKNEKLMREGWARDDSMVQRRVADLKAAGLHPTLASGGGQSSSPVRVDPTIKQNPVEQMMQSAERSRNISMSKTQQQLLKKQMEGVNIDNDIKKEELRLARYGLKLGQNMMGVPITSVLTDPNKVQKRSKKRPTIYKKLYGKEYVKK